MDKEKGVLQDKDVKLKGIDTVGENKNLEISNNSTSSGGKDLDNSKPDGPTDPPKKEEESKKENKPKSENKETYEGSDFTAWSTPETEKEAAMQQLGSMAGTVGDTHLTGDTGSILSENYKRPYQPVDLGKYMPDAREREKFLNSRKAGEGFFELDRGTYGVVFENDVADLMEFKRKEYPKKMKRFLDTLDENQGFMMEMGNTTARFLGSTAVHLTGLLPVVYGLGAGLINWDSSKVLNNSLIEGWENANNWIEKNTVVYGGSDIYDIDPKTGKFKKKDFGARFISDPIKSLNADLAPAASFVAGAVGQELLLGAATVGSFGATSGVLAANTARLANMGRKVFGGTKLFSKSMRAVRGLENNLDVMTALKQTAKFKNLRKGLGKYSSTAIKGVRSAGYESVLNGRSTQSNTLNNLIIQYHKENGGKVNDEGEVVGELIEPDEATMKKFKETANSAGNMAALINVPLVAGSHFVQFPSIFSKNLSSAKLRSGFMKYSGLRKFGGAKYMTKEEGKRVVKGGTWYGKTLGYGSSIVTPAASEAWEEFAQEAIEEGLTNYHTSLYSKDGKDTYSGMISAMTEAGGKVLTTQEGRDQTYIGGVMGLLGVWLPIRNKGGRVKFGRGTLHGGFMEGIRNKKSYYQDSAEQADKQAATMNDETKAHQVNPIIASNFRSYVRHSAAQKEMDEAIEEDNDYKFKNAEHRQMFAYVQNKVNQGLEGAVLQDINDERNVSLKEFNEKYVGKEDIPFTEETKKEALDKATARVKRMSKNIKKVRSHSNFSSELSKYTWTGTARKAVGAKELDRPMTPTELEKVKEFKEQLEYLHDSVDNSKEREEALIKKISEKTDDKLPIGLLDAIKSTPKGYTLDENKNIESTEFESDTQAIVNSILDEWEKTDSESFNMNSESIKKELKDLVELKGRRSKAAALYKGLFTSKGAKAFRNFADELIAHRAEKISEDAAESVKKNAEEAKNGNINKTVDNEKDLTGDSSVTEGIIDDDVRAGIKEFDKLDPNQLGREGYFAEIVALLDKHPGLIGTLTQIGIEQGHPFQGIVTGEEIANKDDDSGMLERATINILNKLSKIAKKESKNPKNNPEFDNADDANQPTDRETSDEIGTTETSTIDSEPNHFEGDFRQNNLVVNVNHKALQKINEDSNDRVVVRDRDGNAVDHPASKNKDYKVDYGTVNSVGFLNDEVLVKENHEFEFRVPDNEWNRKETTTTDNMWVNVVHVDPIDGTETIIGTLAAFGDTYNAKHLEELRNEIARREELKRKQNPEANQEAKLINDLRKKKEQIKNKLKKANEKLKKARKKDDSQQSEVATSETQLGTTEDFTKVVDNYTLEQKTLKGGIINQTVTNNENNSEIIKTIDPDGKVNYFLTGQFEGVPKGFNGIATSQKEVDTVLSQLGFEVRKFLGLEKSTQLSDSSTSQDSFDVGSELSTSAKKKLNKLGFTDSILSAMSKEDVETAKTFSSKEDSGLKELIDKYNTEAPRTSQVQDLAGNTYSVNESDIITYETDVGPIRYITDENGDMVMLSNKNIIDKGKNDIVERVEKLTPKAREHYETTKKTHPNRTLEDVKELQEMVDSLTNSPKDKAIKKGVQLFIDEVESENRQIETVEEQAEDQVIEDNSEINEEIEELKEELSEVNKQLSEVMNSNIDYTVKSKNDEGVKIGKELEKLKKINNRRAKATKRDKLIEKYSRESVEKMEIIQNNFQDIVDQMEKSGMSIFTSNESTFKKCK